MTRGQRRYFTTPGRPPLGAAAGVRHIAADDWAYPNDEEPKNRFIRFLPDSRWRELWAEYGKRITEEWAQRHPGTWPLHWWKFSAPRLPGPEGFEDRSSWLRLEPRLQIGGKPVKSDGRANANRKAIPGWDDEAPGYRKDPPLFEAEVAYLKRHGLCWPASADVREKRS